MSLAKLAKILPALLLSAAACAPAPARAPTAPRRSPITLTYFGAAGWQLDGGSTKVLVDPLFTRPDLSPGAPMIPDERAIAARSPKRADLVLVGHSHADHLLDAPAVARLTGAQIIGTESTASYARAAGTPDDKIITVQGGEDYAFGAFSVRAMPSLHSALGAKHTFGSNQLIAPGVKLPMTFPEFTEGGTLVYLVRVGGHEVLFVGTANFIEREVAGLRPDVAVVAVGLRREIHDYTCRLMRALGEPPLVFANHFGDWAAPPEKPLDDETKADLARFADEVHACAPNTRVVVPEPFRANRVD